jgi:hypothetical protein
LEAVKNNKIFVNNVKRSCVLNLNQTDRHTSIPLVSLLKESIKVHGGEGIVEGRVSYLGVYWDRRTSSDV